MSYRIINGDSAKELKKFKDNSIDAVITDPPYGIEFLAKDWDSNTGAVEIWQECLRVLKPGGFLLAFSAARTYHILATNIQSVGFEIRDQIMWLYASGFPKAQDIGKAIQRRQGVEQTRMIPKEKQTKTAGFANTGAQEKDAWSGVDTIPTSPEAQKWSGWKTALKPAHEPICMARKPFKGSAVDNVLEHGTGALNIDATRIPSTPERIAEVRKINAEGGLVAGDGIEKYSTIGGPNQSLDRRSKLAESRYPSNVLGEVEGYQKYFYKPKSDHEPICMARKPMKGSTIDNVLKHNVGALNIDATRIPFESEAEAEADRKWREKWCKHNVGAPTFQGTDINQQRANKKGKPKSDHEPICMARKPFKGSAVDNVLKHNVGALNIDATRIPFENEKTDGMKRWTGSNNDTFKNFSPENRTNKDLPQGRALDKVVIGGGSHTPNKSNQPEYTPNEQGRFPSNVIGEVEGYQKYFYCPKVSRKERHRGFEQNNIPTHPEGMLDKNGGTRYIDGGRKMDDPLSHIEKLSNYSQGDVKNHPLWDKSIGTNLQRLKHKIMEHNKDVGPKLDPLSHIPSQFLRSEVPGGEGKKMLNKMVEVNKKDPLSQDINPKDGLPKRICKGGGDEWVWSIHQRAMNVGNNHPTVKPVALMKYLIKLVAPKGAHILDPFMGSGTTGMAAKELGITFTGIEMDKSYCDIAKRRIDASKADQFEKLFDKQ